MSEKIISFIIPSYNMEGYIENCVLSIVATPSADRFDVIIVNDGSTDKTLEIAQSLVVKYPQSVRVIDKPNGHYGSCVNAALPQVLGRYVKIVDADDWVNSEELEKVANELSVVDADLAVCPYVMKYEGGAEKVAPFGVSEYSKVLPVESLNDSVFINNIFHACIFWNVRVLEGYKQTERCLYTDLQWMNIPFAKTRTVYAMRHVVYCYRLGRPGQSMDLKVREAHFADEFKIRNVLLGEFEKGNFVSSASKNILEKSLICTIEGVYKEILMRRHFQKFLPELKTLECRLKQTSALENIYNGLDKIYLFNTAKCPLRYIKFWRKNPDGLMFRLCVWIYGKCHKG